MEKMKPKKGFVVVVPGIPKCDFCDQPGRYDFKTIWGPWAHGCDEHWVTYRAMPTLGVGIAQMWVTHEEADDA